MFKDKNNNPLTLKETINKLINRIKNVLLELNAFIINISGKVPFHRYRRLIYRLSGMKIGKGSVIHTGMTLYEAKNIVIGEDTIIGERSVLDGRDSLKIGNHVDIATEVMIYNSEHDIGSNDFKAHISPVVINDYVFIGPRSIILPGVTLGKGCVVGAGAVVTKDVQPFAIVGGIPAKIIGERKNKNLNYKLGRARWFR